MDFYYFVSVSCGESTNLKEKRTRITPMSVFEHAKLQNTMIIYPRQTQKSSAEGKSLNPG